MTLSMCGQERNDVSIHTYRPKVVERSIQAVQLTEDTADEVARWCGGHKITEIDPLDSTKTYVAMNVPTLRGTIRMSELDYLIKGPDGGFQTMSADEFQETYERPTRDPRRRI